MIEIDDKTKCCGCTACVNICPKKCISMKWDSEGFSYPVVDSELCINCNECIRVCPYCSPNMNKQKTESLCLGVQYSDEKERSESTAGGVFSLIADKLLDTGAAVYAVGYDANNAVCHKRTENKEELKELRGSKYVQSRLGFVYNDVKEDLNRGKTVLFVGTPCQAAGLKRVTGENENLYIMDLLCLGVSSPMIFEKYIEYLEKKHCDKVKFVEFRNKHYGYAAPNVRVYFKGGKYIDQRYDSKVYANTFFHHYNVRPCCYECKFRTETRVSDFTIGDFNNIGEVDSSLDDNKGTTKVWIHSSKGCKLFGKCSDKAKYCLLEDNSPNIVGGKRIQIVLPKDRNIFFEDAADLNFSELARKWEPYSLKGTAVSIVRHIINPLPVRDVITKKFRLFKVKRFNKSVQKMNDNSEESK